MTRSDSDVPEHGVRRSCGSSVAWVSETATACPWAVVGYRVLMVGANENTQRVRFVNVNWNAGEDGSDGRFEMLVVTEDDERHVLSPSPAAAATLVALTEASDVVLYDSQHRTLVAANLIGRWLHSSWSAGDRRHSEAGPG